jgi:hypothetical protein
MDHPAQSEIEAREPFAWREGDLSSTSSNLEQDRDA